MTTVEGTGTPVVKGPGLGEIEHRSIDCEEPREVSLTVVT